MANDGRLGIDLDEEHLRAIEAKSPELTLMKPSIVKFIDENLMIIKVSCGNSFTMALSNEGLAYSWG